MFALPPLPPGYSFQSAWSFCTGDARYELDRVYDGEGRLDRERSFWYVTPFYAGDDPPTRWITYAEYRRVASIRARVFEEFAAATTPLVDIEQWIAAARRRTRPVHAVPVTAYSREVGPAR